MPGALRRTLRPARSFAAAASEVALRPAAFFRETAGAQSVPGALIFAAACAAISIALSELTTLTGLSGEWRGMRFALENVGIGAGLWLVFVVLFTGFMHLLVRLLAGRGRRGTGTTMKMIGYSSTAQLGSWLPYVGWLFDLYFLYLVMVGVREAHRTSEDRAIIAILIPLFLIFFSVLVVSLLGIRGSMRFL